MASPPSSPLCSCKFQCRCAALPPAYSPKTHAPAFELLCAVTDVISTVPPGLLVQQAAPLQHMARALGRRAPYVHQGYARPHDVCNDGGNQRVVCAAQMSVSTPAAFTSFK